MYAVIWKHCLLNGMHTANHNLLENIYTGVEAQPQVAIALNLDITRASLFPSVESKVEQGFCT